MVMVLKNYFMFFFPQILEVSLKKDGVEFGFTVAGGVSTGGCYIRQLVSDLAVSDGRLRPGDRILKVSLCVCVCV